MHFVFYLLTQKCIAGALIDVSYPSFTCFRLFVIFFSLTPTLGANYSPQIDKILRQLLWPRISAVVLDRALA